MPANLTGLTPIREFSRKTLAAAYPGGEALIPDKVLQDRINRELWGTGTSTGIYGKLATRGIRPVSVSEGKADIPPELNYSTARAITDSEQDLLNQYQNRQIAAMNAARTAELAEPTFRAGVEAPVTGYYEGVPTLGRTEAETRQASLEAWIANENRKLEVEKWKGIGGAFGSLAERSGLNDWLFGSRGGTGTGGVAGAATQGVVGGVVGAVGAGITGAAKKAWELLTGATTSTPYLSAAPLSQEAFTIAQQLMAQGYPQDIAYEAANATAQEGLSAGGESISNFLANFNPGADGFTGTLPSTAPWDWGFESIVPPGGGGGGAAMDAVGTAVGGVGAISTAVTAYNYLTSMGIEAAQAAEIAASTQAAAIAELAAMSGPPVVAGVTGGLAGANVGAGLTPAVVQATTGLSTATPAMFAGLTPGMAAVPPALLATYAFSRALGDIRASAADVQLQSQRGNMVQQLVQQDPGTMAKLNQALLSNPSAGGGNENMATLMPEWTQYSLSDKSILDALRDMAQGGGIPVGLQSGWDAHQKWQKWQAIEMERQWLREHPIFSEPGMDFAALTQEQVGTQRKVAQANYDWMNKIDTGR